MSKKQVIFHVDETMHKRLKLAAAHNGTNMSTILKGLVSEYLKVEERMVNTKSLRKGDRA